MKRLIQAVLAIVLGGAMVWLFLRGTDWAALRDSVKQVDIRWLILAQFPVWASFFLRVLRWRYVVRAVQPASFRHMLSATQIGFLVNFTVNLRLGEPVRALVLGRLAKMPFSKGLALVALDRVTDLIGLLAVLLVTVFAFRPTSDVVIPAGTFGIEKPYSIPANAIAMGTIGAMIALVGVVAVLVLLYVNQKKMVQFTRWSVGLVNHKLADLLCRMMEQFAQGLHVFRSVSDMAKSIFFSLLTWSCFILAGMCFFNMLDFSWPWYAVFVMQSLLAVAVSLPGTPGYVGQFHLPIVVGLVMTVPGIAISDAQVVAILCHACNVIPVFALGIFCLYREGLSFVEVTREGAKADTQAHAAAHPSVEEG